MRQDLIRAWFAHEGEIDNDESAQVLTRKNRKSPPPAANSSRPLLATESTAKRVSQPAMNPHVHPFNFFFFKVLGLNVSFA